MALNKTYKYALASGVWEGNKHEARRLPPAWHPRPSRFQNNLEPERRRLVLMLCERVLTDCSNASRVLAQCVPVRT